MKIPVTMPFVQEVKADRFWVIGDVHGMVDQFDALLDKIADNEIAAGCSVESPFTTAIVFIGDICDRGDDSLCTLHLMNYYRITGVTKGNLIMPFYNVLGNHDEKLLRALNGHKVQPKHGLVKTLFQIGGVDEHTKNMYRDFLATTPLTIRMVLNEPTENKVAVAVHAAFHDNFYGYGEYDDAFSTDFYNLRQDWSQPRTMEYAIYGPVRSVSPEGKPDRIAWEDDYNGKYYSFYGHKIVGNHPKFSMSACGVDTGCFQSGILTAVSYPELTTFQVTGKPASSQVE